MREIINQYITSRMKKENIYSDLGKVLSVDDSARTCEIEIIKTDLEFPDVRIQAQTDLTAGVFIKPKVDSIVVVSYISPVLAYISLYSEIDEIEIKAETKIVLKQGSEQIDDLFEKQREIQEDINALKAVIKNWTPVATDGGAALKAAAATWFATDLEIVT